MGIVENYFEEGWEEVVKIYKEDWKNNLKKYGKKYGKKAINYLLDHFYSEADVESFLSCFMRDKLREETHYNSEYVVRNQVRFGTMDYDKNIELKKLKNLKIFMKKEKVKKNNFIPDIVIDSLSNPNNGTFLLFAELTYQPSYKKYYKTGDSNPLIMLREKADEEARTLTAAIDAKIIESGYICIISDELVSKYKDLKMIRDLKKKYHEINFLVNGMTLKEKLNIIYENS